MEETIFTYEGEDEPSEQASRFQAAVARRFFQADFCLPDHPRDISLRCAVSASGLVQVCHTSLSGHVRPSVRRTRDHIHADPARIAILWFPLQGEIRISQDHRTARIDATRFGITTTGAPFEAELLPTTAGSHLSLTVSVAHDVLEHEIPSLELIGGRTFSLTGVAHIAQEAFCSLGTADGAKLSRTAADMLAAAAVRALGEAIAAQMPDDATPRSIRDTRVAAVRDYIDLHISDPTLTASRVAANCGMSLRYLHLFFERNAGLFGHLTFRHYVREQRLARAKDWLVGNGMATHPISWIAFKCGFASNAHFSRAFRERFGANPSQVRKDSVGAQDVPKHI